jgi:hypothetical protein
MSRTNVILLAVLVVVAAVWAIGRDWDEGKPTGPAPRLFPSFNKEAADGIVIEGGWQKTRYAFAKRGSDWLLSSAGDYAVKKEAAERLIDAVYNLRQQNELGSSADLQQRTHTDATNGRLVTILRAGAPTARFRVGKNPKGSYQEFFVRVEDADTVYRCRTVLTKDRESAPDAAFGGGPQGFDWHNYINNLSTKWVDTKIWDLAGAEAQELWLTRKGELDVKLVKKADDKWDLIETGKEPVPGDADAAEGILGQIRSLSLYEVAGTYEQVSREHGLDEPEITLVMTLRQRLEQKEETKQDDEKEAPKPEYVTINRILEVGPKVTRPRYDSYGDKFEEDEYYPIRIGPRKGFDDADEERRTNYVFLVNSYKVGPLKKTLEDLKAEEPKEEEKQEGEQGETEGAPGEAPEKTEPEKEKPAEGPEKTEPKKEKPAEEPEKKESAADPEKKEPGADPEKKESGS